MLRVLIPLAIIIAVVFVIKLVMDYRGVDRPERIGRKDRKAFEANYLALRNLVDEIDLEARVQQEVSSTDLFARQVAMKIAKARKELA